jgi:hypothetical protein
VHLGTGFNKKHSLKGRGCPSSQLPVTRVKSRSELPLASCSLYVSFCLPIVCHTGDWR